MSTDNPRDLEPIEPSTAQELSLDHKANQCSDVTVQSYEYRTNYFVEWCDANGIDNMNDLSGRDVHQYRLWRKEEGELNKISMQTQMCTIRVFLEWCGTIEAVDPDLYNKVLVPQVNGEGAQLDVMLDADHADEMRYFSACPSTTTRPETMCCSRFYGRLACESARHGRWICATST